ncbi:MAG: hypothetical protein ACREHD_12040, partial [Pirellulales bacterium]
MRLPASIGLGLVLFGWAANASAAIIVTVGNTLVASGGAVDYLPVYISTDVGQVDLAATGFQFEISASGPTALQFADSSDPSSDPTFGNATYVFAGVSEDVAFGVPLGLVVVAPSDPEAPSAGTTGAFIGGDLAYNEDFSVPLGTTPELLAMLPVMTLAGVAPPADTGFTVTLDDDPTFTFFNDANGDALSITADSFNTATFGPTAPTVTPEPSTWLLGLEALAAMAALRLRRKPM